MNEHHGYFQKCVEPVQEALKSGLADPDSDTRSWARKAFWAFADHFKFESDLLLTSVEQGLSGGHGDSASVSGLSTRSRQSSVARSNESLDSSVNIIIIIDTL